MFGHPFKGRPTNEACGNSAEALVKPSQPLLPDAASLCQEPKCNGVYNVHALENLVTSINRIKNTVRWTAWSAPSIKAAKIEAGFVGSPERTCGHTTAGNEWSRCALEACSATYKKLSFSASKRPYKCHSLHRSGAFSFPLWFGPGKRLMGLHQHSIGLQVARRYNNLPKFPAQTRFFSPSLCALGAVTSHTCKELSYSRSPTAKYVTSSDPHHDNSISCPHAMVRSMFTIQ